MKPDIRIRHTKENIRKSFFTLLSQKEFCQITVTDICNLAEINRSTFYKHYLDIIDLLEQTENEILDKIRKLWKKLHPKNTIEGMESILSETQSTMWDSAFYIFKADPDFSYKITEIILSFFLSNDKEILPAHVETASHWNRIRASSL